MPTTPNAAAPLMALAGRKRLAANRARQRADRLDDDADALEAEAVRRARALGITREVAEVAAACKWCAGTGDGNLDVPSPCTYCGGTGRNAAYVTV